MKHYIIYLMIIYLVCINAAAFISMLLDKHRARNGTWRIRERTLLLMALAGGSVGALIGMYTVRHKTRHLKFKIGIPLILILQICLIVLLLFYVRAANSPETALKKQFNLLTRTSSGQIQLLEPLLQQQTGSVNIAHDAEIDTSLSGSSADLLLAEAADLFYKDFSYQILSTAVSENEAEISLRITGIDSRSLAKDLCLKLTEARIQTSGDSASYLSRSEILSLLITALKTDSYSLVTEDAAVRLRYVDQYWELQMDDQTVSLLSGHLAEYISDPYLLSPAAVLELYLVYYQSLSAAEWENVVNTSDLFATGSITHAGLVDEVYFEKLSECLQLSVKAADIDVTSSSAGSLGGSTHGSIASVPIEVTSLNMPSIMQSYRERLIAYAKTADSITADSDSLDDTAAQILASCIQDSEETLTQTAQVEMQHDGRYWYPEITVEITDMMLGNLSEGLDVLNNS